MLFPPSYPSHKSEAWVHTGPDDTLQKLHHRAAVVPLLVIAPRRYKALQSLLSPKVTIKIT